MESNSSEISESRRVERNRKRRERYASMDPEKKRKMIDDLNQKRRAKVHASKPLETPSVSAEKLLSLTSKQVMEMEQQGKKINFQHINKRLQDTDYIVQLHSQTYNQQGKTMASYSVTSLHDSELYATTNNLDANNTLSGRKKKVDFQRR